MPGTYPAAAPTLSGDTLSISRFLQNPAALQRRLRNFRDLRFVADQILTGRYRSTGGAVLYEMSEPSVTDRTLESVGAGAEYPFANLPPGTAAVAAIQKWGQKVRLTDEEISRNAYAGSAVDRSLQKVVNSIIKQVDTVTMSAVASAITANGAVGGGVAWSTVATAKPLTDILLAVAAIRGLNLGYNPDTLVLSDTAYVYLMVNDAVAQLRQRETTTNPVYTGNIETVAGLTVLVTPNLPVTTTAIVLDSTQLGGMADEMDGAPGYAVSDLAVQVKSIRLDGNDAYDLQGRRKTVPIVQEPGAGYRITGVL
jgi:hypothetical protein